MITETIIASVIAGTSVCSDHFENASRFNPTELSTYQECVLAAHSNETAGTLGGIFWVKVGDTEFVSMPVKTLRNAGSKEAAKTIVTETIIEEVIVERIVEVVTEDTARIEQLQRDLALLRPLADQVPTLMATIREKEGEIMRLMGLPTYAEGHIAGFTSGEASARNDFRDDINSIFGTSYATWQEAFGFVMGINIEDGHGSTVTQRTGTNIFDVTGEMAGTYFNQAYVSATLASSGRFIAASGLANGLRNSGFTNVSFSDLSAIASRESTLEGAVRQMARHILDNVPAQTLAHAPMVSDIIDHAETNHDRSFGRANIEHTTQDNVSNISDNRGADRNYSVFFNGDPADVVRGFGPTILTRVADLVEKVYDEAYADGYEDGYVDGYRDGFADGQASVTIQ